MATEKPSYSQSEDPPSEEGEGLPTPTHPPASDESQAERRSRLAKLVVKALRRFYSDEESSKKH